MSKIYGQKIPLTQLYNAVHTDHLHHSILMYGPDSCGKFETAMNLAKTLNCTESKNAYCDKCKTCLDIHFFRSAYVLPLLNDSRTDNLHFWCTVLTKQLSSVPNRILFYLLNDFCNIISRHNYGYCKLLVQEKRSYPEGKKITANQLEDLLAWAYETFDNLVSGKKMNEAEAAVFLEKTNVLQNCLDRTIITKDTLDNLRERMSRTNHGKRIVIIQNIEKIHPSVAGTFLKLLEEPPPDTFFILICSEIERIPEEIIIPLRSRCFELGFSSVSNTAMKLLLQEKYGLSHTDEISFSSNVSTLIRKISLQNAAIPLDTSTELYLEIFSNKGYNLGQILDGVKKTGMTASEFVSGLTEVLSSSIADHVLEGTSSYASNNISDHVPHKPFSALLAQAPLQLRFALLKEIRKSSEQSAALNSSENVHIARVLLAVNRVFA